MTGLWQTNRTGIRLTVVAATALFFGFTSVSLFLEYLERKSGTPFLNPWFVGSFVVSIPALAGITVLANADRLEDFRFSTKWTIALMLAGVAVVYVGVFEPERELTVLMSGFLLVCLFSPAKVGIPADAVVAAAYLLQEPLLGHIAYGTLFVSMFLSLHVVAYLLCLTDTQLRSQKDELSQARWAATKFANLNLDIQNRMYTKEHSVMVRERTRIAHEIHDTVGHALTSVLYQVRSLRRSISTKQPDTEGLLTETEDIVARALTDMRNEVYCLRDTDKVVFSWPVRWRKLCMVFAECTGVRIMVNLPENLDGVGEQVGETVFRVIQESLTNSIRHGRATYIDVSIVYRKSENLLLLRISDNGIGAQKVNIGVGISGIIQRAHQIGGEVAWQTEPNRGFDLGMEVRL